MTAGRVRFVRADRPGTWRSADVEAEAQLPEGGHAARRAGVAPDLLHHARRGADIFIDPVLRFNVECQNKSKCRKSKSTENVEFILSLPTAPPPGVRSGSIRVGWSKSTTM
jgi:hypothetical protein